MLRGRREERREERQEDRGFGGRGGGNNRYQMREKMFSIGDDFWVENEQGQRAFRVDGKALRVRQTLIIENAHGQELLKIQEKMIRIKDSMEIENASGQQVAMVKKALISPLRDRFTVEVADGPELEVQGNIVNHEYEISHGRDKVAEISKKWFRIRDSYGIEVEPGQNDALIIAIAVCVDQMSHDVR
jgi:uncharacterized protein YxjI